MKNLKKKDQILKRYLVFLLGLFINSFGVSFVTKACLGTSPISSIPYVLSLYFPPTLGNFTIAFSLLLIFLQIVLLGKKFNPVNFLQIPVSVLFGYFIDLSMIILSWVDPQNFVMRLLALLVGCTILGFGVYIEVIADVVMLPGEGFVKAVTARFGTDFGKTKICFDGSMTIIAAVISFVLFHTLNGVGLGTIIAALLVGFIAGFFGKKLAFFTEFLFGKKKEADALAEESSRDEIDASGKENGKEELQDRVIITIAREYGSGGRQIAKSISEKLQIPYFDSDILAMAAKEMGISKEELKESDQKSSGNLLFDLYSQSAAYSAGESQRVEEVFEAEKKVILNIANKQSCIIVGRLANFILGKKLNAFHVFLYADAEDEAKHIMTRDGIGYEEARKQSQKVNRERAKHCLFAVGKQWGAAKYYDLCLNTSRLSVEEAADCIIKMATKQK